MGVYSKELKSLDDLPQGAKVAIPNDPTNGGRALLLLQAKGLIKLADGVGLSPTPLDVTENAKGLQFLELDAAQLPRVLADAEAYANNAIASAIREGGIEAAQYQIAMRQVDVLNTVGNGQGKQTILLPTAAIEAFGDAFKLLRGGK